MSNRYTLRKAPMLIGYAEGGVPYGVTWEEHEESEARAATLASQLPPTQLHPVSLDDISQEMQIGLAL